LALPVGAIVALAIKLTSPGPVFFTQERAGFRGQRFRVVKFRSMAVDAEVNTGPVLSSGADPRVTRVGRALRRFRVDEIPQLWNVLKGEMSLVGPRPERPEFMTQFMGENPLYERRLLVKPGLTGLAQIHGRYDTDYTQKLRYDLVYLNSMSLATDLRILAATVRIVLTGKGAL
jgi:lipopolysaccharide/colanic/teichoic acid biosynthesis glycosyltransferase